jgi:hypothetical protein
MRDRLLLVAMVAAVIPGFAQSNANLQTYFRQSIGLSQHEITSIQSGTPITKPLPSRTPSEVFLFGAVYIHAAPGQYLRFSRDFNRLRKLPDYLALEVFGTPPKLSDLKGFSFEDDDVQALRDCALADCQIQLPEMSIEELHRSVDWTAADANQQANQFLQKSELRHLMAYQREGDLALGVYDDKRDPAEVAQDFASLLSYDTVLPGRLPEFYHYILVYPNDKPANVEDLFYWEKVKFGLKPTLRVVQVLTRRGNPGDDIAYAIAEKQLYSSHYFETSLDFTFCVRGDDGPNHPGFYLIMVMGSKQAGLNGFLGSIVRDVAVDRSVSSLQHTLTTIKRALESGH